jgi:serine/threonine-protein kinase
VTDLFLSYKAEDRARVAPLVQALETDGLSVWWDAHIGGGDDWRDTILRHLEEARGVIVVWSKRSIGPHGHFVRDEAARALKRGTYFPVRIDKVDPPLGFGETQAFDLTGWKGDRADPRYQAMIGSLRKRLGLKPRRAPRSGRERVGIDRRTIVAGGALAVAAAGIGGWAYLGPASAGSNRIAVMPFANLSGDPSQAYFSDGIAEELRNALSRIPALEVIARTSSDAVRNDDAKSAAQRLGVAYILAGSVRRSPSLIRISAQLVDAQGIEQWSEVYDRPSGDALQIQTDIASKVADALRIRLGRKDLLALAEGGTRNPAAQDLLLKARALVGQNDSEATLQQALGILDSALALDPQYADALAAKAGLVANSVDFAQSASEVQKRFGTAEQLARRAVALAPRSARARSALATTLYFQFKIRAALAQYAIMESLPGEPSGDWDYLGGYVYILNDVGGSERALRLADRMIASDPLNPWAHHARAQVFYRLGRYEEAKAADERAIALGPALAWPKAWHALILMRMGKLEEAKAEFAQLRSRPGVWLAFEAVLAERQGDRAAANRLLKDMQDRMGDTAHYQYAWVFAQQGRKDEAIAELEKAWKARDPGLTGMKRDEFLRPLHGDPRFEAIVRRLDFPVQP